MQFSPVVDSVDARKWATMMRPPTKVDSGQEVPNGDRWTMGAFDPTTEYELEELWPASWLGVLQWTVTQDLRQLPRANDPTALRKSLARRRQELVQDAWNAHQVFMGALQEACG